MGFLNKIMKAMASSSMSAVVGTTDTIAKHYLKLKGENPRLSDKKIYKEIIEFRYSIIPLQEESTLIIKNAVKAESLRDFILDVLVAESPDLLGSGSDFVSMTLEIIEERLKSEHNL